MAASTTLSPNITEEERKLKEIVAIMDSILFFVILKIVPVLKNAAFIFDILMVIFFVRDFFKKNSFYRKPFFILLFIGYSVHLFENLHGFAVSNITFFGDLITKYPVVYTLTGIRGFYLTYFYTIWNVALILNKFTGLWFPIKHNWIWSKHFSKVLLLVLGLPFLLELHFFLDMRCHWRLPPVPIEYKDICYIKHSVTLGGQVFLTLILFIVLGSAIIIFHKKTAVNLSPPIAKIEKRLMYQCLTSLLTYEISTLCNFYSTYYTLFHGFPFTVESANENSKYVKIPYTIALIIYHTMRYLYYLIDITMLLIFSNTFRTDFLNFYTFGFYGKVAKKMLFSTKVTSTKTIATAALSPPPKIS